jgi:hypothetical protein
MTSNDELAAEIAGLRARVQRTEDTLAIYELKARYAELVDSRYERGAVVDAGKLEEISRQIADLFAEDAVWDGGARLGEAAGRAAIIARMRRPTLTFSRHLFVKPRIRIEGDRASGRWDLLCPCRSADGSSILMSGYEDDEYVRGPHGVWLHQSMRLTTLFFSPAADGWGDILA